MDAIIIGAGAAGLMAAKKLSEAGLAVCILEARNRLGGRVHTINDTAFPGVVEAGAEFIHGNLPVTLALLQEAGMDRAEIGGEMWEVKNGNWSRDNEFFKSAEIILKCLKGLKEDVSVSDFLDRHFSEKKFEKLRSAMTDYVEGYYSGEITKTSALSFLEEWESEDEQQYRPVDGYGKLLQYLANESVKRGTEIHLSTVVKEIRWAKGKVEITDEKLQCFTAKAAVITVPTGVWLADENAVGRINYLPAIPEKQAAVTRLGFGSAIKVLLYFRQKFWLEEAIVRKAKADLSTLHMALSDEEIPTWWTQSPKQTPLLTGWLSGPKTAKLQNASNEEIISKAIASISAIFALPVSIIQEQLLWSKVFNWSADPFTRGSYSYSTTQTAEARKIMLQPVEQTLFFAGEALYDGPEMGTVEAALISGRDAAEKILLV